MNNKRYFTLGIAAVGLMLTLTACVGNTATKSSGSATPKATNTVAAKSMPGGETGGEGGVEAALVTYTDAAQRFSIGHPGPWTQDASVKNGVKFTGGDSSMTLEFATITTREDALTYAKKDAPTASKAFPGFKQVGLDMSTEVPGAAVLGFEAKGTSAVTGKSYTARGDRYYIPMSDGRLAVLTVVDPFNNYDREGVRDIALTLKSTQ